MIKKIRYYIISLLLSEYEKDILGESLSGFVEEYERYCILSPSCDNYNVKKDVSAAREIMSVTRLD